MKKSASLSLIRYSMIVMIIMSISACGFQLRGDYLLPDEVQNLSITSFDQYSDLTRKVKKEARLNGIYQVTPNASTPNLNLISERLNERTLSIYQNSREAEVELRYIVRYSVLIPGDNLKQYTTTVTRSYLDNPLTALAKSVERDMIEEEMHTQAAQQILRQMARLKADEEDVDDLDSDSSDTVKSVTATEQTSQTEGNH